MRVTHYRRIALALLFLSVLEWGPGLSAWAQTPQQAPTITLDRSSLRPGERVIVTLSGWTASVVTLSVCGNLAKRGSSDCNMSASQAVGLSTDVGYGLTQLTVAGPPVDCPCVIRASGSNQNEVALAPIDLIGIPISPLVDPVTESPLVVSIEVKRAGEGLVAWLKSMLGGARTYDVTLGVRNRSRETLSEVALNGAVGRNRTDEIATFRSRPLGDLAPGATASHTARVRLPPPVVGTYVWRANAKGAGQAEQIEQVAKTFPKPLVALVVILLLDLLVIAIRGRLRRRRNRATQDAAELMANASES